MEIRVPYKLCYKSDYVFMCKECFEDTVKINSCDIFFDGFKYSKQQIQFKAHQVTRLVL